MKGIRNCFLRCPCNKFHFFPVRAVRCVEASHDFATHDEVFEDFVDRVADMRIAVGVRRTFVQKKAWSPAVFFAQSLVKTRFLLAREDFR